MRGSRRSLDLVDETELIYNCTCETYGNTDGWVPLGWTGRPVNPWSAHVIAATSSDNNMVLAGANSGTVISGTNASSCKSSRSGPKCYKSDHSRTTACNSGVNKTTARCNKRMQSRTTGCQTRHSKPNQWLQTNTTNTSRAKTDYRTTTNCKVASKPTRKPSLYRDVPAIPFNMGEIHSNPHYVGLKDSLAHLEHYLFSYTYPQLEQRLADSLAQEVCPDCGGGWGEDGCGGERRGGRGAEEKMRPSIIQVLVGDSVLKSSHSHPTTQRRSRNVLAGIGSHSRGPPPPNHLTTSHSCCVSIDSRAPPSQSYPQTQATSRDTRTTHTPSQSYPQSSGKETMDIAAYYRKIANRHQDTTNRNQERKKTNSLLENTGSNSKPNCHAVSQSVYEMGIRLTPDSFPPLVVSSTHSLSSHKPPLSDRSSRPKKKQPHRSSRKRHAHSTESLAGLVVSASSFHQDLADRHKTPGIVANRGTEEEDGTTVPVSAKTLSPFQTVLLPNVVQTSPCEPLTMEKEKAPQMKMEEQQFPRGKREPMSEPRRHKKLSHRRREDSLFLRGMSTGLGGRGGKKTTGKVHTKNLVKWTDK